MTNRIAALATACIIALPALAMSSSSAAPQFTLAARDGRPVSLVHYKGQVVMINFWASWCGPCNKEAPQLARLSRSLHGRATLVGVDWNDSLAGARGFIRKNHWSFPNLRDADGTVGYRYRLNGLPNSFVLDRDGRIARIFRGPQTTATFERALREAG
jgi:cytochrome c biogenesis protein CcmG/thiol:disulfide interchange protein DsbE